MSDSINTTALAQNLAEQCKKFEASPEYAEMLKVAITKLYGNAIDEIFRWGDFPKNIKKSLEEALPNNISDFVDLAKYNHLVINQLKDSWNESGIQDLLTQQIQNNALKMIEDFKVPEFVLLSEIFEYFIKAYEEEATERHWERPNILCVESEIVSGYWDIAFEAEPEQDSTLSFSHFKRGTKTHGFQFENCLCIREVFTDNHRKDNLEHNGHKCFELISGKVSHDILGKKIIKPHYKYEKLICALYFGNAYLVWDDFDPDDVHYPSYYD